MLNMLNASIVRRTPWRPNVKRFCSVASVLKYFGLFAKLAIGASGPPWPAPNSARSALASSVDSSRTELREIVEARARRHAGARDAQRLVHPVARDAVAVQVAAVGDDVERRFAAVVDDHAELDAQRQIDLAVRLEAVAAVLGVGAEAQIRLRSGPGGR